jgi:DNA-binding NtrC family response regulator
VNTLQSPIRPYRSRGRLNHYPRILIIDDDPALLESLTEMLKIRLGRVHIETCRNPALAVGHGMTEPLRFNLCDVSMPDINGLALLPPLRHSAPDAAIVIMSAIADKGVQGATVFLAKPFDRDVLTATLKHLLTEIPDVKRFQSLPARRPVGLS